MQFDETTLIILLAFSLVQFVCGGGAGWWVRSRLAARVERALPSVAAAPPEPPMPEMLTSPSRSPAEQAEVDLDMAEELLEGLQVLASDVAANVGQHSVRVQAINDTLTSSSATGEDVRKAIAELMAANASLRSELDQAQGKITEQTKQIEASQAEARTDQLTGVPNRRVFDSQLRQRYGEWFRLKTPVSLAMIDIDKFKQFNDKYGHATGDYVLKSVAQVLTKTARDIDLVTRYGGEEFGVIMPGTVLGQAQIAVERLRRAIESATYQFEGQDLKVTISIGVAELATEDTLENFPHRADEALYAAKAGGRNCGYYHNGEECLRIEVAPAYSGRPATGPAASSAPKPAARLAAPAPAFESAPVAVMDEEPADDRNATSDDWDRRDAPRRSLDGKLQPVAPLRGDEMPDPALFYPVRCLDISSRGFSFVVRRAPDYDELVVALGVPPKQTYVSARIIQRTPFEENGKKMIRVGCEFTNRINTAVL